MPTRGKSQGGRGAARGIPGAAPLHSSLRAVLLGVGSRRAAGAPLSGALRALQHADKRRHRDAGAVGGAVPHPDGTAHGPLRRAGRLSRADARPGRAGPLYRGSGRLFRRIALLGISFGAGRQLVCDRGPVRLQVVPAAHAGAGFGDLRHRHHRDGHRRVHRPGDSCLLRLAVGVLGVCRPADRHGGRLLGGGPGCTLGGT